MKNLFIVFWLGLSMLTHAQQPTTSTHFQNPVLPGFYPDPSVCRVGDDYYMVNSSFEWWPGVPIHHSKDLIHWKPIGYVLNRPSQLTFKPQMPSSAGIWAPTIRYHKGLFYVIVTCMQCVTACNCGNNFYVTAASPYGPWSEPVWVDKTYGIDPTLFFDDDGKTWYVGGTQGNKAEEIGGKPRWKNEHRIYLQQIDIRTGKTFGSKHVLTSGHASNAVFVESPHLYKINGKYLLLVAEGGTWRNHAVTGFISDSVSGPYTALQENPLLTHRHLGYKADISTTGHADLVHTQNNEWWAVVLGVRDSSGYNQLGRETFLTSVTFQGSTPFFNYGIGRIRMQEKRPDLPWTPVAPIPSRDEFEHNSLQHAWNFLRTPLTKWYSLTDKKGGLTIQLRPEMVSQRVNPSLIARRIQHHLFTASLKLVFKTSKANECAGMVLMQNDSSQYRVEKIKDKIQLIKLTKKEKHQLMGEWPYTQPEVVLSCTANGMEIQFFAGPDEAHLQPLGVPQDMRILSSNWAGGFIGPYIGMYASSNDQPSKANAWFDWFEYRGVQP